MQNNSRPILSKLCSAEKDALHQALQHSAAGVRKVSQLNFSKLDLSLNFAKACESTRNDIQWAIQDSYP
ncbi:MAG: hypothetical protein A2Y10_10090 [Planctomycetes bacterium GWF2_41_51]|nr:MAG: hypothetical protein A2Y10_10090 [Planctomycetes bacterium GWF2_41_51]HBG27711.1 hypothetical protein [Phycisphaerales bacterium]